MLHAITEICGSSSADPLAIWARIALIGKNARIGLTSQRIRKAYSLLEKGLELFEPVTFENRL